MASSLVRIHSRPAWKCRALVLAGLALTLAAPAVLAQEAAPASDEPANANACLTIVEGQGGMTPNVWQNDCDYTVTVKWFDEAFCEQGCVRTLEDFRTSFTERHGETVFAACRGTEEPIGFDAIDDTEFTCPPVE